MSIRIEPTQSASAASRPGGVTTSQNMTLPAAVSHNATRIEQPRSVLELAEAERATFTDNWILDPDALTETQENLGFAMGDRLRSRGSGGSGSSDRSRPRSMVQRLAGSIVTVDPEQMQGLRQRIPGLEAVEDVDDLMNKMRRHQLDSGETVLLLGLMLNDDDLTHEKKQLARQALSRVMENEQWVIQLFSTLEFGITAPAALASLRQLYQRAIDRQPGLVYWFSQFRQLTDRQRKLKTLIKALAFDLHAGQGDTIKLAATITDLKKIVQFLTIEDHGRRLAAKLAIPGLTGEEITAFLIDIIQQSWVYSDWLSNRIMEQLPPQHNPYQYVRGQMELIKLLPETCFNDSDQQATLIDTFLEYLEKIEEEF